jgi:pyruvate:ferredoxin oxidoreductase-like protein/pyruvate ferredoxin/flavodoxin oxidoreductase-like protein
MFEVRTHGRGGQDVVTAAELLSVAAFREGRYAQAFPSFGSERTGAPVVAFCRIHDREILRAAGARIGMRGTTSFRPFPLEAVRDALGRAGRVAVLEQAPAVGLGGILSTDVRLALPAVQPPVHTMIAGLGGRPITTDALRRLFARAMADELSPMTFPGPEHQNDRPGTLPDGHEPAVRATRREHAV